MPRSNDAVDDERFAELEIVKPLAAVIVPVVIPIVADETSVEPAVANETGSPDESP
jgi:hypothetical protein